MRRYEFLSDMDKIDWMLFFGLVASLGVFAISIINYSYPYGLELPDTTIKEWG